MNGIRLPDPIIPNQDPFIDKNERCFHRNNDREVKGDQLRGSTPRDPRTFDIKNDPISTIRMSNNVPQNHALGRNVYRPYDTTGVVTPQNTPEINQLRKVPVSNRFYNQNYEPKGVNYDPLYDDLNNTVESNYTERISSVDSFDHIYYRHNDPDHLREYKHNQSYKRNGQNKSRNHVFTDRERLKNYEYLCKIQKGVDRIKNYMNERTKDEVSQQVPDRRDIGNNTSTTIACTSVSNGINESDIYRPSVNLTTKQEFEYSNHYCELTKEELFNGLGSIGLALSKVFRLTGNGVLYLCSSISDNAEALFDTENRKKEKGNNLYSFFNPRPKCTCHPSNSHNDFSNLPDLHINYESCCPRSNERTDFTGGNQSALYVNGKRAEVNRNYMNSRNPQDREYMTYNNKDASHRNTSHNRPNEYDAKYTNQPNYKGKIDPNGDNVKIDYDTDLDYYEDGHIPQGDNRHNPCESQISINLYRGREISRDNSVKNNKLARDYSFDDSSNGPQYDFKNTEPANHTTNFNQFENRSVYAGNFGKMGTTNISVGKPEFKGGNLNAHGFDKYKTVDLAEKNRKNTDIPNFGKPNVSAYGPNSNEPDQAGKGPWINLGGNSNVGSTIVSRNSPNNSSRVTVSNSGTMDNSRGRGIENARLTRGNETQSINTNSEDSNINKSNVVNGLHKLNEPLISRNLDLETPSSHRSRTENEPKIETANQEINNKLSRKDVNLNNIDKNSLSSYNSPTNVTRISMSDTNSSIDRISLSETDSSSSGTRSSSSTSESSSSGSSSRSSGSRTDSETSSSVSGSSTSGSSTSGSSTSGSDSSSIVSKGSTNGSGSVRSDKGSSKSESEPEIEQKKKTKKRIFPFYNKSKDKN